MVQKLFDDNPAALLRLLEIFLHSIKYLNVSLNMWCNYVVNLQLQQRTMASQ